MKVVEVSGGGRLFTLKREDELKRRLQTDVLDVIQNAFLATSMTKSGKRIRRKSLRLDSQRRMIFPVLEPMLSLK